MAFAFIIFLFNFSLSSHFFNWFFLSPNRCSFLFKSDSQLLPQPQTSFFLYAPQIKPKNGVGCVAYRSRSHANGNSNSQFKTKPRNGIITNQKDLHPVKLEQHGRPWRHNQTPQMWWRRSRLDLASIKLCSISPAAISPSRSSRSLQISPSTISHTAGSLFFLLRWLWWCFLRWLLWVVFGGFVFLDGCSGLCLVNLSCGWLI